MAFSKDVLELDCAQETERITTKLREAVLGTLKRKGIVVALSGGIDSSVVGALSVRAFGKERVFGHDGLGVNLQPLRFLEFLLEDVDQVAIISAVGSVLVTAPDPARYALHKILVYAERRQRNPEKATKDLRQAAALIEVLSEFRADSLEVLWKELIGRGAGWRKRARTGLVALEKLLPGAAVLASMRVALEAAPPS